MLKRESERERENSEILRVDERKEKKSDVAKEDASEARQGWRRRREEMYCQSERT